MSQVSSLSHELDAPPWQRVDSTIMQTARAIRRAYETRLAPLDLNLSQASILGFLANGPTSQTQVASSLGIGRAAAGSIVDTLEKRGLVERQPDPNDRRVWLVAVTKAGAALAKPVQEIDRVLRTELRAGISRNERQQLAELLVRLQSNLTTILGDEPG
jgi:DNA-binding MarR family transcriptional regulator